MRLGRSPYPLAKGGWLLLLTPPAFALSPPPKLPRRLRRAHPSRTFFARCFYHFFLIKGLPRFYRPRQSCRADCFVHRLCHCRRAVVFCQVGAALDMADAMPTARSLQADTRFGSAAGYAGKKTARICEPHAEPVESPSNETLFIRKARAARSLNGDGPLARGSPTRAPVAAVRTTHATRQAQVYQLRSCAHTVPEQPAPRPRSATFRTGVRPRPADFFCNRFFVRLSCRC